MLTALRTSPAARDPTAPVRDDASRTLLVPATSVPVPPSTVVVPRRVPVMVPVVPVMVPMRLLVVPVIVPVTSPSWASLVTGQTTRAATTAVTASRPER